MAKYGYILTGMDGVVMTLLPRYEQAVIPVEKLTKYALSPQADPDKAKAFELALGYNTTNANALVREIRKKLPNNEAKAKGDYGFGETYEVVMDILGPNGKTAKVLTAWIDDADTGEVRLITVHVD